MSKRWIAGILLVGVVAGYWWFLMPMESEEPASPPPPPPPDADVRPPPPATPFVFTNEDGRYSLPYGNAHITESGLLLSLTDVELPCKRWYSSAPGHTFWMVVPLGPEKLWVGRTIDVKAGFREGMDEAMWLSRDRISLTIEAIDRTVRGHLAVAESVHHDEHAAVGSGDFEITLCDPAAAAAARSVPDLPAAGPVRGEVMGRPFRVARAYVTGSGPTLVLADDPAATCETVTSSVPGGDSIPPFGLSIQLLHVRPSSVPRLAEGFVFNQFYRTPPVDGDPYTTVNDMPGGFSLTLEGDITQLGNRVHGVLRGYSTKEGHEMRLGGTFEAEVCHR